MPTSTLACVRELTPTIQRRSEEIENARRLPLDLVDELKTTGAFRMLVPHAAGGDELPLRESVQVIEELAAADGSTGWTVMIGGGSPLLFGLLPRAGWDQVYADGPDVIGAGALAPKGRAVPVADGYCISGQWQFASGCQHASWLIGHCVIPRETEPELRIAVFPAHQAEIVDTWKVSGLRGTGSHDFTVNDVYCPEERTLSLFNPAPAFDAPMLRLPTLSAFSMLMSGVALGIARGALADLTRLAIDGKRRAFAANRLSASPVFQDLLGEADATLRGARALVFAEVERAWHAAVNARPFELLERARIRSACTLAVTQATRVVDACYTAGGGTSLYEASPLQRRLRDIHALTQHIGVSRESFAIAGAFMSGEEVDLRRPL